MDVYNNTAVYLRNKNNDKNFKLGKPYVFSPCPTTDGLRLPHFEHLRLHLHSTAQHSTTVQLSSVLRRRP